MLGVQPTFFCYCSPKPFIHSLIQRQSKYKSKITKIIATIYLIIKATLIKIVQIFLMSKVIKIVRGTDGNFWKL